MPSVGMERSSNLVHHHFRMEHEEQRCECCPYGYHIDLDFVPFTKKMLSREGDVERLQELKDKWRSERTSMDKLLGVDAIAPKIWDVNATISRASTDVWRSVKAAFELEEAKKITRESHGTTGSNGGGSSELIFENGLSEAVTDFEEALLRTRPQSKILSYEIPDTQKFHTFPRIKAPVLRDPVTGSSTLTAANLFSNRGSSSNTSTSVSTVIMKDSFAKFSSRELDKKSDDSLLEEMDSIYNLTSAPREREATRDAAVRIRDMEEQLKRIPELEVKVTLLAEEKRQLMKLLEVEKQKVASARSLDSGDSSSPPAVPPRRRMRDACVGIAPVTRDIGVSFISPRTRSIGVAVGCGSDSSQWDRMLRGESTSPTGSYTGTLKRRILKIDAGVQVSDYQLADPKTEIPVLQIVERVDKAIQTMPGRQSEGERSQTSPLLKSKSLGTQVKPTVRDYGVSASQPEPVRSLRTSAVNTDKLRTSSVGCNTTVIREPTELKPVATFSSHGLTRSTPQLERRLSSEEESGETQRYSTRLSPTRTRPSPTRVIEEDSEPIETSVSRSSLFSRASPPRTFGATSPSSTRASVSTSTTRISSSSTTTSSSIPRPASLSTVTSLPETKIQSRIPRYQSSPLSSPVASGAKPVSSGIPSVSPDRSLSPMDASPLSSSSSSLSSAGSSSMGTKPVYKRSDTYTKDVHVPDRQPLGLMRTLEPLEEEDREGPRSSSASSSSSGRPNALHSEGPLAERIKHTPSAEMQGALKVLNDALLRGKTTEQVTSAISVILHEWFRIAGTKSANAGQVEDYLDSFEVYSPQLLRYVVNMPDGNGNTALHYAVSHGNFDVVSILLDSKVCDPNKANKAGYTCIMLVALARIDNDAHRQVVRRLFSLGDVNIKAAQHGQTALMLGASHGRYDTVKLLIEAGADLNIQDEDGSTALMCAAEHGHIQIAQFLVCQPECDLQITDNDGSTAFTIAMEGGHKDVALILYAQVHCQPSTSPTGSSNVHQRSRSTTPSSHASTSNSSSAHTSPIASVRRMNTS